MRPLNFLAALAAVTLVHILLVEWIPETGWALDLFLVVLVLNALPGNSLGGMVGGFATGVVRDGLSGGIFGLQGFAGTIIGYAVARVAQRLVVQRAVGAGLVVAGAVVFHQAVLLVLSLLVLPEALVPDPVSLLIRAAASGVVGTAVYSVSRRWQSSAETRRRRGRPLRLD